MSELRVAIRLHGLDRVVYDQTAQWDGCSFMSIDASSALVEMWEGNIHDHSEMQSALHSISEKLRRLILALEWTYGHKLKKEVDKTKTITPAFGSAKDLILEVESAIAISAKVTFDVPPRKIPPHMPEIPVEASRWVTLWVETGKLSEYVEEQLRRHYLIIEELWDELHGALGPKESEQHKRVKLIRDFVSHARCDNKNVITLVESDLPSAVVYDASGNKRVAFDRSIEHRNFVSRFEVVARGLARSLVEMKMQRLGIVRGV